MAIILNYASQGDAGTTFTLASMTGTVANQTIRAFRIGGGNAANLNWGTAGFDTNGLFGTTAVATGTFNAWSGPTATGAPGVSVTFRLNTAASIITFEAGSPFWLAFVFDEPTQASAYTWDDTGWQVGILNQVANAAQGLYFAWGRNVTHQAGSARTGRGGFTYSMTANYQSNNAFNQIINAFTPGTNTSAVNWFGCTIDGPVGGIRSEQYLVFPTGFTGTIRNFEWNTTGATAALPNFCIAGPTAMTIDQVGALRSTFGTGAPATLITTGATVLTNTVIGNNGNFLDRQQPLGASVFTDYTSVFSSAFNNFGTWRGGRLNLRANAAGGRSLVPQIFNGWQFLDSNGNQQAISYFYTDVGNRNTVTAGTTNSTSHLYDYAAPGQSATNQVRYDVAYQSRYVVSTVNADGSFRGNCLVSITNGTMTDGSRTRYIDRYAIASGLMTRTHPTSATSPQAYLIGALNTEVLGNSLYMYGACDTNSQSATNLFIPFTNQMNAAAGATNSLSPAGNAASGNNTTFDVTNIHALFFDRWGVRLQNRLLAVGANQLTTPYNIVLVDDPYIKVGDDSGNTNRAAARALNVTITQSGGATTNITTIAVGTAYDGNDIYAFLESWARDITAGSSGYLRPLANWSDPGVLLGALAFISSVTAFNVNAAITNWTPTTGKLAINRIALISGTVTFAANTVATTTMRFEAPTININSQVITNGDLIASTAITNLPTTGTIMNGSANVNFGTSSAITLTGNSFFTLTTGSLSGTLTLTPNGAGRVVSFTGVTLANLSGFNLVNAVPGTLISLIGWVGTIPNGFQVLSNYSVTLPNTVGFNTNTVRVNKLFRNNTAGDIVTPVLASTANGITVSWGGNAADRFNYCGFVDTLTPIYFEKPASSLVSPAPVGGVVIDPANLDFTQRANFITADTTFINGTTWTVGSNNIAIMSPNAVYDKSASRPISKMVVRALMENGNANPFHFGIATAATSNSVLLVNSILFNELGTASNTGWALLWAKSSSSNNVVVLNLWNVNELGVQRTISSLDVTTQIQFAGFSPGAVSELTGEDIAVIATASAEANLTAFNTISDRVNQASKIIPSTTTPITT